MKSDSKQHYDNFEFFPLYGAEFGQIFPFLVTCRKIDAEPKAIAMRLFVLTHKGNSGQPVWFHSEFFWGESYDHWLNEPITHFSFFPPFALFLAPQI
jgi:hypothetical protein